MPNLISHSATEILLDVGDILFREGDPVDCGYIIESGELVLYADDAGEREYYERRGPGSIVGELSILTGKSRSVTVEAVQPCRIFRVSAKQVLSHFEELDPVLRACISTSIGFAKRIHTDPSKTCIEAPLAPSNVPDVDGLIEKFRFEQDILTGLDKDQFYMAYQPIMDLVTKNVIGFEALMRWQHPTLGNVPPSHFIEVAESTGSICKLTDFALMEACGALRKFRDIYPNQTEFFASVNVSGVDITRQNFTDFIAHVLDLFELNPRHLKIEVTETALVVDCKQVTHTLDRLRMLGCGISIDDFGTGYSNLAYLKQLPLTALKIDRAFAGDAHDNKVSRSIVKMMLGLGAELGVDVIAEGLETQADVDILQELGCKLAQGYYFSKPISERDLCEIIAPTSINKRNVA